MSSKTILAIADLVKAQLSDDVSGHDWTHIERVRKLAVYLAQKEGGDRFVIELAALLHDIPDWKLCRETRREMEAYEKIKSWLRALNVENATIYKVCAAIETISFEGALVKSRADSLEARIVQDADKLDAIGAIGVARTFAFGSSRHIPMYDENLKPVLHASFEEYKKMKGTTINHFYEKLLLLKDRMYTETAKKIAEQRHKFMESFLENFLNEWHLLES